MPSVRVRRTDYAQLDDQGNVIRDTQERTGLGSVFPSLQKRPSSSGGEPSRLSPPPATQAETSRSRRATISVPKPDEAQRSPSPVIRRPRAGSRVADHIVRPRPSAGGLRQQRSTTPLRRDGSVRSSSTTQSPVVLEGSQADVVLDHQVGDEPGFIGSALSVHSGLSIMDEDEHHHDDIVEHLDVIDPQVAAVSSLTNATNSILIPPFSFISRKPVVHLTSPTQYEPSDAAEKGDAIAGESGKHEDALDRHVEDILARPSKIRRTLQGVWSFLKTPMGVITGIYGFLVVFWGAAIVFFLAKFINFHNAYTQGFWVEVSSQVVNALFTVTGIGLIPWRAIDTYRIYKIWAYKRRTKKLREKAMLPQLYDVDDLPDPAYDPNYVHVLSDKEQADLHKQQIKFKESQTWYRPHGTETHRAFPINTALLICLFIDGNSFFQIILCGTMWGLNRFERPAWSTGCLIPLSFLCGILSAIFIWKGGQKTKRTKEVEERLRLALAMDRGDDAFSSGRRTPTQEHGQGPQKDYQIVVEPPNDSGKQRNESNGDGVGAEPMMVSSSVKEER